MRVLQGIDYGDKMPGDVSTVQEEKTRERSHRYEDEGDDYF